MKPTQITQLFDAFLSAKGLRFEAVVIGGSALALQGVIDRETVDIDCLDPKIPTVIARAAKEFARDNPELFLIETWLNNGPDNLVRDLPQDWRARVAPLFTGQALTLHTLGRADLLKTKLYAYCDRGDDFKDCLALKPSQPEIDGAYDWVSHRDSNPNWPDHVRSQFLRLKKALGYV